MSIPNIREFTEFDWNEYAGAERFSDGSAPLICETDDYTILCDNTGVEVDFEECLYVITIDTHSEVLTPVEFWMPEIARLIIANLAKTFSHKTVEEAMEHCDNHGWVRIAK